MCGMGGDLWAIIHPGPGQAVQALNASGRAGSGADPDRLRAAGHEAIPPHDDIAAVPVPGCVDGWVALNERFGRLPLAAVLEPARHYAAEGFPATPELAQAVPGIVDRLDADDYRVPGGVRPGTIIRRPGVARALAAVAEGGRDAHYLGEFGEGLMAIGGGEFTPADLACGQADWVTPLSAEAWGRTLWTVPPNSQGYLTLASAWIASGLELPTDADDPLWAHLLVEASRQAAFDRIEVLHEGADGAALLDPSRLGPRRDSIRSGRASQLQMPGHAGDTIALCAVDGDRQGITLIQSNAGGWGSGLVVPGLRIFLHNRGQGFSLQAGHPAEYGPGRRPPHTLAPALVTHGAGELAAVIGTMGGDAQPQILLQLLARTLHGGEDPGDALAAGRFTLAAPAGSPSGFSTWTTGGRVVVQLEEQPPSAGWAEGLRARGHEVVIGSPWSGSGHAHLIEVAGEILRGGTDPRPRAGGIAAW
jgi:gamma-glutamyltranspeptidase/glutathione hydrolase